MSEQFISVGINQRLYAVHNEAMEDINTSKDRPLVIMLHSFPGGQRNGTDHIFSDLNDLLLRDGLNTLRFDFRGGGNSSGTSENFTLTTANQDLQAVLGWAWKQGYERYVFIGEGLGATVALMNMSERIEGLILLWPMLDFRKTPFKDYSPAHKTVTINGHKVSGLCIKELMNTSLIPAIKALRIPVLVQHGDADEKSPIKQLEILRKYGTLAKRVDITSYGGGTHGLPEKSQRETLFHHVHEFLKKYT